MFRTSVFSALVNLQKDSHEAIPLCCVDCCCRCATSHTNNRRFSAASGSKDQNGGYATAPRLGANSLQQTELLGDGRLKGRVNKAARGVPRGDGNDDKCERLIAFRTKPVAALSLSLFRCVLDVLVVVGWSGERRVGKTRACECQKVRFI